MLICYFQCAFLQIIAIPHDLLLNVIIWIWNVCFIIWGSCDIFNFLFRNDFLPFSGDWKDLEFKDYNYGAQGQPIAKGYVQPLM